MMIWAVGLMAHRAEKICCFFCGCLFEFWIPESYQLPQSDSGKAPDTPVNNAGNCGCPPQLPGLKMRMRSYSICFRFSTILPSFPTPVGSMTRVTPGQRYLRWRGQTGQNRLWQSSRCSLRSFPRCSQCRFASSGLPAGSLSIPAAPYSFFQNGKFFASIMLARALIKVVSSGT